MYFFSLPADNMWMNRGDDGSRIAVEDKDRPTLFPPQDSSPSHRRTQMYPRHLLLLFVLFVLLLFFHFVLLDILFNLTHGHFIITFGNYIGLWPYPEQVIILNAIFLIPSRD